MKTFTVEQANRTLPLVRRIVADIMALYPRWRECVAELEVLAATTTAGDPESRSALLERLAQTRAAEIEGCIREIRELGIEYKLPLDAGLVDFPGEIGGRSVYLCWRFDESSVQFWHELDAGFAGRQPLTPQPVG